MGFNRNLGNIPQVITELNGNIGIGITNPTAKLHISGNANSAFLYSDGAGSGYSFADIRNTGARLAFGVENSTGSTSFTGALAYSSWIGSLQSNTAFQIVAGNSLSTTFLANGNVGIGTTSPGAASANTILGFVNGSNIQARTSVPQIAISSNIDGDWYAPTYKTSNFASQIFIDGNGGTIGIRTAASGTAGGAITWNNGLRMDSVGNVGIGTTSPSYPLTLEKSDEYSFSYKRLVGTCKQWAFGSDNSTTYFRNMTDGITAYTITNGGNVLIGTTTDAGVKLDVNGAGRIWGNLQIDAGALNSPKSLSFLANSTTGGSYGNIKWYNVQWDGNTRGEIQVEGDGALANGRMVFKTGSSGSNATEKMRITSGGQVLVGATSDAYGDGSTLLSQSGGKAATFQTAASSGYTAVVLRRTQSQGGLTEHYYNSTYCGGISITTNTSAYGTSSDYRLKEDLKSIKGLDLISQVKVYDYKWKSVDDRAYGVLAHELQEVIPQAVIGEKDAEQMQGVDYSKLVPILVQAIQEQQETIKQLTNRIINLENK